MLSSDGGHIAPYGNWISPITAEAVAAQSLSAGIEDVILDQVTSKVYFAQKRPQENGRSVIVDANDFQDMFDASWDARTQLHEYGGGAARVHNGVLYFSNVLDHRVYRCTKGSSPTPITPVNPVQRFADFVVHPEYPDLIVAVVEDHTNSHPAKVLTYLALINASKSTITRIAEGADFYAVPRFSPKGKFLVWQQWYFPEMPQQSSEIKFAAVSLSLDGSSLELSNFNHVAGKHEVICAQEPDWASNDTIFFVCDVSGFHNPWKFVFDSKDHVKTGKASPILPEPLKEEFGLPQWWLTRHGSGSLGASKVAFMSVRQGMSTLYVCDIVDGTVIEVSTPFAHIEFMHGDGKGMVVMLGQPAHSEGVLAKLTLNADGTPQLNTWSPPAVESDSLPSTFISPGEYMELILPPDNRTCHMRYYAPKNVNYKGGLPGEKPPVLVLIHGGPFYMQSPALDWKKQFFTSRGWAYVDVNYGGSTGFGRAFRESLHGKWGILDIHDAHQSVVKLAELGLVDSARAAIYGGSAGGYSTLQMATTLPHAFAVGSPHYGVSDMRRLDEILHKFEYDLCDRLMGGTWEECRDVWIARSPIYHVDKIEMPLLILQGLEDTVVPAEQMKKMAETLKARGKKAEIVLFEGEGHGWRKASTMQIELEKQLSFFNEVLGLQNS